MLKKGIIHIKKTPDHRRERVLWSATFQIILQTITFAGGAIAYRHFVMPEVGSETYEQGYGSGYRHAHDLYAPKSK